MLFSLSCVFQRRADRAQPAGGLDRRQAIDDVPGQLLGFVAVEWHIGLADGDHRPSGRDGPGHLVVREREHAGTLEQSGQDAHRASQGRPRLAAAIEGEVWQLGAPGDIEQRATGRHDHDRAVPLERDRQRRDGLLRGAAERGRDDERLRAGEGGQLVVPDDRQRTRQPVGEDAGDDVAGDGRAAHAQDRDARRRAMSGWQRDPARARPALAQAGRQGGHGRQHVAPVEPPQRVRLVEDAARHAFLTSASPAARQASPTACEVASV